MSVDEDDLIKLRYRLFDAMGRGQLEALAPIPGFVEDPEAVDLQSEHAAALIVAAAYFHNTNAVPLAVRALAAATDPAAFIAAVNVLADLAPERGVTFLAASTELIAPSASAHIVAAHVALGDLDTALLMLGRGDTLSSYMVARAELTALFQRIGDDVGWEFARHDAQLLLQNADFAHAAARLLNTDGTRRLLSAVIDEERTRAMWAEPAAEALRLFAVAGDQEARFALLSRANTAGISPFQGVAAALTAQPGEAYEELYEQFRTDRDRRFAIADGLSSDADPRWVDEAVRIANSDAQAAATTLARIASPRAREELVQWIERAERYDDALKPVVEGIRRLLADAAEAERRKRARNGAGANDGDDNGDAADDDDRHRDANDGDDSRASHSRRVCDVLLRWLFQSAGTGRERLLLAVLAEQGTRAHAERIDELARSVPDPTHYERALALLRTRGFPA